MSGRSGIKVSIHCRWVDYGNQRIYIAAYSVTQVRQVERGQAGQAGQA